MASDTSTRTWKRQRNHSLVHQSGPKYNPWDPTHSSESQGHLYGCAFFRGLLLIRAPCALPVRLQTRRARGRCRCRRCGAAETPAAPKSIPAFRTPVATMSTSALSSSVGVGAAAVRLTLAPASALCHRGDGAATAFTSVFVGAPGRTGNLVVGRAFGDHRHRNDLVGSACGSCRLSTVGYRGI